MLFRTKGDRQGVRARGQKRAYHILLSRIDALIRRSGFTIKSPENLCTQSSVLGTQRGNVS